MSLKRRQPGIESLETRQLLAANMVISEFMASNDNGLRDVDQQRSDWIELLNNGDQQANLDGWFLTDDAGDLDKWRIPDVHLGPNQRLVIFASGKNRSDPAGELHTNFRLDIAGEYVALIEPDGLTVASAFGPQYPEQLRDVSYGIPQRVDRGVIAVPQQPGRLLVPTPENGGDALGQSWTALDFDDSGWTGDVVGIGYERASGYEQLIGTDTGTVMYGINQSAYLRYPFQVTKADRVFSLTLGVQYDDGYVAYINGQEVARRNAPAEVTWNSGATAAHRDRDAVKPEEVEMDITQMPGLLHDGRNVLAIHALNDDIVSTDFLMVPQLTIGEFEELQVGREQYFRVPTPGEPNDLGSTTTIVSVVHEPNVPNADQPLQVTATLLPLADPVSTVTLHYRVMFDEETSTPMFDDGLHGDGAAGDGVFAATLPAGLAVPGQMIRYRVTAGTDPQNSARAPLYQDELNSEQYYGTVVADPSIQSNLPVIHWFLQDPAAADVQPGTRGALFHDGKFYDNIEIDPTGRSVGLSGPKKSHDIFFTSDHWFELAGGQFRMNDFDVISDFWNRAKVRVPLGYQTFLDIGTPAHLSINVRVQLNGEFYGTYFFVDGGNEQFLERAGLDPRGALYKMNLGFSTGGGTFKKQTRTYEDISDLRAFFDGLALTGADRTRWLLDNVNIPAMVNFLVGLVIMGHGDCCGKNLYIYRDTEGTGEWEALPWDVDSAFGRGGVALPESIYPTAGGIYSGGDNELISSLFQDVPGFRDMYLRRLRTLMDEFIQLPDTPMEQRHFENRIDAMVAQMAPDAQLDFQKWGSWKTDAVTGKISYDPAVVPTWEEEVAVLRNEYFPARRVFLYNSLKQANGGQELPAQVGAPEIRFGQLDYSPASGNQDEEYIQLLNPNSVAVDISGWQLAGGVQHTFHPGTVIPAGGTLYVSPNVNAFRARGSGPSGGQNLLVQGSYQGHISNHGATISLVATDGTLLDQATTPNEPLPEQQFLRISEIMYHPRPQQPAGRFARDDYEFIELLNTSASETLDLRHVRLSQGVDFQFPEVTLAPGQRVVVVQNREAFVQRYGEAADVLIAGQYGGTIDDFRLSNGGEALRLEVASGDLIQEFAYSDGWLPETDGGGYSLTVANVNASLDRWNVAGGWQLSAVVDGTPGRADSTAGDFDANGRLDAADIDTFCGGYLASDAAFDLTGEGLVDQSDLVFLIQNLFGSTFGDANLDRSFNSGDLVQVLQAGEYEDGTPGNSTWAEGDWDCDGDFGTSDIVLAFQYGQYIADGAAASVAARATPAISAVDAVLAVLGDTHDERLLGRKGRSV